MDVPLTRLHRAPIVEENKKATYRLVEDITRVAADVTEEAT
jgi:hypothetical protein